MFILLMLMLFLSFGRAYSFIIKMIITKHLYIYFFFADLLDDDNMSTTSVNQNSSNEELDEVEDKMPDMKAKKVCDEIIYNKRGFNCLCRRKSLMQLMIQ
jgi:hypothetical protein